MEHKEDPLVISTSCILPAKPWEVLRLITRVQDFPKYMPNVKECKVLKSSYTRAVTLWKVEMGKIPISWQEEDWLDFRQSTVDLLKCTIRFKAIAGDLEKFEGYWRLQEHPFGGYGSLCRGIHPSWYSYS